MKLLQLPTLLALLITLFVRFSAAADFDKIFRDRPPVEKITTSCHQAIIALATFCLNPRDTTCVCRNDAYAGSYFNCVFDQIKDDMTKAAFFGMMEGMCHFNETYVLDTYHNATAHMVNVSTVPNYNRTIPITYPIYYSPLIYVANFKSMENFFNSYHHSFYYGGTLTGYLVGIFFFGGIIHWFDVLFPKKTASIKRLFLKARSVRLFKKHIVVPSLFNGTHAAPAPITGGFYPTRGHSVLIGGYFIMWIVFLCISYRSHVVGDVVYSTRSIYLSRVIADRAGIICVYLIIMTFLLAGRNNLFIWWTGWKQSTFFAYHKAVARTCVLSAVIHACCYVHYYKLTHGYSVYAVKQTFWKYGSVAVVAGGIMLLQANGKLRALNYEVFLYLHIMLAIAFMVGAWHHVKDFDFTIFVYFATAFWAFDRFVRVVRILSFGVKTAQVRLVHDEVLVVTMPRNKFWPVYPGAFGYIYFMKTSLFWQSHPFSVVESEDGKSINLYIKIKKGATSIIMKQMQKQGCDSMEMKVLFEGPYGSEHKLDHYDHVMVYSSGNGIPGVYPYIIKLLKAPGSEKKTIKFNWIIQTRKAVDWFRDELAALQRFSNVEVVIHVTRHNKPTNVFESSDNEKNIGNGQEPLMVELTDSSNISDDYVVKEMSNIDFKYERPCIDFIVREDLSCVPTGDVAVLSCCHGSICDAVRAATADLCGSRSAGTLDYIEELQAW